MTGSRSSGSLMRNLGAFFGHVWAGVRADPGAPRTRREVRRRVEEESRDGVILRRTTIEEVELPIDRVGRRPGSPTPGGPCSPGS